MEQKSPKKPATGQDHDTKSEHPEPQRDGLQGEGNYGAARAFDEAEREFVESGRVQDAARAAPPKSEEEQQELIDAEEAGKRRAKK